MLEFEAICNNIPMSNICRDKDLIDSCISDESIKSYQNIVSYKRKQLSQMKLIIDDINKLDVSLNKFHYLEKPLKTIIDRRYNELKMVEENIGYCNKILCDSHIDERKLIL